MLPVALALLLVVHLVVTFLGHRTLRQNLRWEEWEGEEILLSRGLEIQVNAMTLTQSAAS